MTATMKVTTIVTIQAVEDVGKKRPRITTVARNSFEQAADEGVTALFDRAQAATTELLRSLEQGESNLDEMRARLASLSEDLKRCGYHDASRNLKGMVKDLRLSDIDDDEEEEDEDY